MAICIIDEPDVAVTSGEFQRYKQEYFNFLHYYAGPHISLEDYIRNKKRDEQGRDQGMDQNGGRTGSDARAGRVRHV